MTNKFIIAACFAAAALAACAEPAPDSAVQENGNQLGPLGSMSNPYTVELVQDVYGMPMRIIAGAERPAQVDQSVPLTNTVAIGYTGEEEKTVEFGMTGTLTRVTDNNAETCGIFHVAVYDGGDYNEVQGSYVRLCERPATQVPAEAAPAVEP